MEENKDFVIHIFGYGETQYIQDKVNFKTDTKDLTKVQAIIDAVWAEKPTDYTEEKKYHAINIFNYNRIDWSVKEGFIVNDKENEFKPLIDELIAEITSLIPEKTV